MGKQLSILNKRSLCVCSRQDTTINIYIEREIYFKIQYAVTYEKGLRNCEVVYPIFEIMSCN